MGFLDLFGKRTEGDAIRKHAQRVANKRAQTPDRWDAIEKLAARKTPEAVTALLARFTYVIDPSITDQDEKDLAFSAVVSAGEVAVAPVKTFLQDADSLAWPLKILDELLESEAVVTELLKLLEGMDTEYERDPQRKHQVLGALSEREDSRIVAAVVPFLDDVDETTRFYSATALLHQPDCSAAQAGFVQLLAKEESQRIINMVIPAFAEREWSIGDARESIQGRLPPSYTLSTTSVPTKQG